MLNCVFQFLDQFHNVCWPSTWSFLFHYNLIIDTIDFVKLLSKVTKFIFCATITDTVSSYWLLSIGIDNKEKTIFECCFCSVFCCWMGAILLLTFSHVSRQLRPPAQVEDRPLQSWHLFNVNTQNAVELKAVMFNCKWIECNWHEGTSGARFVSVAPSITPIATQCSTHITNPFAHLDIFTLTGDLQSISSHFSSCLSLL